MTSNTSKPDVDLLAEALDGSNRQRAEAIGTFVNGRIAAAIDHLREEVTGLVVRQKENISEAKGSDDSEVKASANESTKAVKAADEAVKQAEADPTPEKAAKASAKVEEAKDKVDKTESDLTARVSALEEGRENHEQRICALEDGQTGLAASVEGLWVSVRAHAHAIATGGGAVTGLRRAARLTIATFLVVVAIWLLLVFTPWVSLGSWNVGLGLAAIAAGLVYAWQLATLEDNLPEVPQAEAQANAGVDIVRTDH
jgi:hypothetical protein